LKKKNLTHIKPLEILPKVEEFLDAKKYYKYEDLLNDQKIKISAPLPKQNLHESLRFLTRMLNFQSAKESKSLLQNSNLEDQKNKLREEEEQKRREEDQKRKEEEEQRLKEEDQRLKDKEQRLKDEDQRLKDEEEKEKKRKEEEEKEKNRKEEEEKEKKRKEEEELKNLQQLIEEKQKPNDEIKDNDTQDKKDELNQEKNREKLIRKLFELEINNLSKILPQSKFEIVYGKLIEFNTRLQGSKILNKVEFEELYNKVFNFEFDVKSSQYLEKADLSNLRREIEFHGKKNNKTNSYSNKLMTLLSNEKLNHSLSEPSFKQLTNLSNITLLKKSEPILFDNTEKMGSNIDNINIKDVINYKIPELVDYTFSLLDLKLKEERNLQSCVEIFKFIETEFSNISKVTKLFDYDVKKLSLFINENYIKGK